MLPRVRLPRRAATVVVLALCCIAIPARADPLLHNASGQETTVPDASRIVSIGGAVTEILYALGQEARIVAVDTTSLYPERALKEKPNVGYMRQLSPEGVLGLSPSLVLASESSGPKETIAVLESAKIPYVQVPEHFTRDGIVEKIRIVARAVGADAGGACLVAAVDADLEAMKRLRARIERPVRVLFLLSFVNGRPMVAGRHTAADGIIALAGAINVMDAFEGYKPVSDEALAESKPDFVLAMRRSHNPLSVEEVFAHPALKLTPAGARQAFIDMEGTYLLGFGPRTALAARDLAVALQPQLGRDVMPSEQARAVETCRK